MKFLMGFPRVSNSIGFCQSDLSSPGQSPVQKGCPAHFQCPEPQSVTQNDFNTSQNKSAGDTGRILNPEY